MRQLDATVKELEGQLETRKAVDRDKGILMDQSNMSENDAFGFVQKTAMAERSTMRAIADRIITGGLRP